MTCILDLQIQLTTVFITLVALNVVEIIMPILLYQPPEADLNEGQEAIEEMKLAEPNKNSIVHDIPKDDQESMLDE